MVGRKKERIEGAQALLIVTHSAFEGAYFNQMRKDLRYSTMSINTPDKDLDWKAFIDYAARERIRGKYQAVYAVMGALEAGLNTDDIDSAVEYAEKKSVGLLYFVPSFSLYFVLFNEVPKAGENIQERAYELYDGLEETLLYLNGKGKDLNQRIYPRLLEAERNAERLNDESLDRYGYRATSLPEFLVDIKRILGKGDMSQAKKL